MIDFYLAKELSDAGFPQGGRGHWVTNPNAVIVRFSDRVYGPTLSELIKACGEELIELRFLHDINLVVAHAYGTTAEGLSAEEAVARLWLALNRKEP